MSRCQLVPPALSPQDDEDALQMALPELVQRMVRGPRDSQVGLEADSDEDAAIVTLDDGSVWKPYWQREQRPDEAIRASGERPPDLKSRIGSPRPLSIGDDVARTPDALDMSRPPTEASEKTDPAGQVGDFQHDVPRSDKPPEASRDDTLSEGLPAVDAKRANASLIRSETVQEVRPLPNANPDLAERDQTLSKERTQVSNGRDSVTREPSEEQIVRRRPVSVTSMGDSKDSLTSKQNVFDGPPSTKSSRSHFGDLEVSVLRALRPVHVGATQTELSTSDASTQTTPARIGYQKMAAGCVSVVFILIYLYLCYVLTLYTKHFYETDIKEDLDFL